ncbi:TniQ family protein [Dyadobacter sp. BHUBP1]|uniref:TniQ family protein n=1 Tax=Dyadobacter sp. BHUBP1 TaxID=3424178 RepID=UPI003D329FE5
MNVCGAQPAYWPVFVFPKEDELLSSWLVRLSQRLRLKVQTFCSLAFAGTSVWNRDIDKLAPEGLLQVLASRTPVSFLRVQQCGLKDYEGRVYLKHNSQGNTKWILPLGIYHRTRKSFGLLFCPMCLQKDGEQPYFRKSWRLSFSVVCPTCHIYLHDRCPQCDSPVMFFRGELGHRNQGPEKPISTCSGCGFDLAFSEASRAPVRLVRMQKKLYSILGHGWKKEVIYSHLYFDVLGQVLKILLSNSPKCKVVQNDLSLRFGCNLPSQQERDCPGFDFLPLSTRTALLRQACWLLEGDCKNLIFICTYHGLTSSDLLRDMKQAPFWYDELVTRNFFVSNANRTFLAPAFRREELGREKAPVNGLPGPKRKYGRGYICKRCDSDWMILNGKRSGNIRIKCRNCGAGQTVAPGAPVLKLVELKTRAF